MLPATEVQPVAGECLLVGKLDAIKVFSSKRSGDGGGGAESPGESMWII